MTNSRSESLSASEPAPLPTGGAGSIVSGSQQRVGAGREAGPQIVMVGKEHAMPYLFIDFRERVS